MLGINVSDDLEIAGDFLTDKKVGFLNLLDSSPEAQRALSAYERPGRSAVPLTYLIDAEGRVLDAWYGYSPARSEESLEKIGRSIRR